MGTIRYPLLPASSTASLVLSEMVQSSRRSVPSRSMAIIFKSFLILVLLLFVRIHSAAFHTAKYIRRQQPAADADDNARHYICREMHIHVQA